MDINFLRIAVTVLGFVCFLGICIWAYSKHARKGFEEASMLPFTDEDEGLPAQREGRNFKQGNQHG
jgi:cytochrome c oxidase cbb3-type subunit 4